MGAAPPSLGVSKQAVQQRFVPREPGTVADYELSFTLKDKGRNYVGTEHLLLALLGEEQNSTGFWPSISRIGTHHE